AYRWGLGRAVCAARGAAPRQPYAAQARVLQTQRRACPCAAPARAAELGLLRGRPRGLGNARPMPYEFSAARACGPARPTPPPAPALRRLVPGRARAASGAGRAGGLGGARSVLCGFSAVPCDVLHLGRPGSPGTIDSRLTMLTSREEHLCPTRCWS